MVLQEEETTKIINSLIDRYLTKKKSEKMEMQYVNKLIEIKRYYEELYSTKKTKTNTESLEYYIHCTKH